MAMSVLKILERRQRKEKGVRLTRQKLMEAYYKGKQLDKKRFKAVQALLWRMRLIKTSPNPDDKRRGKSNFYFRLSGRAVSLLHYKRRKWFWQRHPRVPPQPTPYQLLNNTMALRQRALESAARKATVYTERADKLREEKGRALRPVLRALSAPNGAALARERVRLSRGGAPVDEAARMTRGWAAMNLRFVPSTPPSDTATQQA